MISATYTEVSEGVVKRLPRPGTTARIVMDHISRHVWFETNEFYHDLRKAGWRIDDYEYFMRLICTLRQDKLIERERIPFAMRPHGGTPYRYRRAASL